MRYRKKPVEIDAIRFDGTVESYDKIVKEFDCKSIKYVSDTAYFNCSTLGILNIPTMEGTMVALPGDFIIKGGIGELYPCKPEVFHATYGKVEPDESV